MSLASVLVHFCYLQLLDLLTTVAVIANGGGEANPLVRFAMSAAPSPLSGLLTLKLFSVAMAVCCWCYGRRRVVLRINWVFAGLVVWNLFALILRPLAS